MSQTFQVLRCYRCAVFQVHPTTKANKWKCKQCSKKQSIIRFYKVGTGKECRLHVQKLNGIRGQIDDANGPSSSTSPSPEKDEAEFHAIPKISKWHDFIDAENEDQQLNSDYTMHLNETEVVLEQPKKGPEKAQNITKESNQSFNKAGNSPPVLINMYTLQPNEGVKNICEMVPMNPQTKTEIPNKQVISSTVAKSKWAKLLEDLDKDSVQEEPLFSFYDDDDLDAILDL